MEVALKIAYQYHCERGESERTLVISRRQSYHGSTLAMLAISGNAQRRSVFEPVLGPAEFVSPCYEYRDRRPEESQQDYAQRLADELEAKILEVGPAPGGGVHRRDGGRLDQRRGAGGARLPSRR